MRSAMVCLVSVAVLIGGVAGVAVTAGTAISEVTPMPAGNVLLAVGGGKVEEHTPAGALVQTLDSTTGTNENDGMCFDSAGNLYSTNGFSYGSVAKFDPSGALVNKDFVTPAETNGGHPESCVADSSGNIYVGLPDSNPTAIQKYSSTGTLLHTYEVAKQDRGSDWLDLASDQCTLYYTSEGNTIFRYNACTSTQLTPFATGLPGASCYAHRLLADGSVLVACSDEIVHLNSSGTVINTFSAASLGDTGGFLFAMNIDPDGTTFWTADYDTGQVIRANISNGAVVGGFTPSTAGGNNFGGLTVIGEITAGQPTTTTTTTTTTTVAPATTTAAPTTAAKTAPTTTATAAQPVKATPTFTG